MTQTLAFSWPFIATGTHGVSSDAQVIKGILVDIILTSQNDITFAARRSRILDNLLKAASEASVNNWDSYGAKAVTFNSFQSAISFLTHFPSSFQDPDVAVDPDGEVLLEWYVSSRRRFLVSVSDRGTISYAGIFGINKIHGTEEFVDKIPEIVIQGVARVFAAH